MYRHILIATDGSELATKGLKNGLALAKDLGAAVTIVAVSEIWSAFELAHDARSGEPNPVQVYERAAASWASKVLLAAGELAEREGLAAQTVHVADTRPAEGITKTAADNGCDLIVMASHGRRGISRLMLGSVASEVVAHSTIPILIVR